MITVRPLQCQPCPSHPLAEARSSVEVRKTEYVIRGGGLTFPNAPRRRRPRARRSFEIPPVSAPNLDALHATAGVRLRQATSAAGAARAKLEAVPWDRLRALPWTRLAAGVAAGVLLLLFLSAFLFEAAYAERVYPKVHALGVDLGGKSAAEAQAALGERMTRFVHEPVALRYAEREWRTTPDELGWRLEVVPLTEAAMAVGRQGNPLERLVQPLQTLFVTRDLPQPAAALDIGRARALLQTISAELDRPVGDASIAIETDGQPVFTSAQTGRTLDIEASLKKLQSALLVGDTLAVPLVVQETAPKIADADLAGAREQVEMLLGKPVLLTLGTDTWTVGSEELQAAVEWVGSAQRPRGAQVNRAALERALKPMVQTINQPASNARFEFVAGEMRVLRESKDGREVDAAALVTAVEQAMARPDDRTVTVPAKITPPAVISAQRSQLGIRELLNRGETRFAGSSPPKIHNIKLAASRLHGVVVPPGALFSFNRELGPTTLDSGYQVGWGIAATGNGGHATVPSVAGGICQVATTLFQPVFWGGYQIEERHSHLYWIQSYGIPPLGRVGLDATVDEDSDLDLRFVNNSPDYVLIQAVTDDASVYISLYGNKPSWTVNVEGPTITNRRSPNYDVIRNPEPSLPWGQVLQVESASDGFDAAILRTVRDGGTPRTLNLVTNYSPSQNLVVVGTKGAPVGAAEEVRASNVRSAPAAPAASASSVTAPAAASAAPAASTAPATSAAPAANTAAAPVQAAPVQAVPAAAAPAAAAEPVRQPAAAPVQAAPVQAAPAAAAPAAPVQAAPAAPVAPSLSTGSAPAYTAPAPAAPVAPAVPRFGGS